MPGKSRIFRLTNAVQIVTMRVNRPESDSGAGGTDYTWTRYTSLERYAESCNLIVLMPNIDFSFAMNMANGLPYQTYLAQELPALARQMFHVDFPRENIAVAGQSMGGFGALHTALSAPEIFGACGDMDFLTPDNRRFSPQFAQKPGVTCEYHEYPGGHNYDVWDPCIRDFVQWLMA